MFQSRKKTRISPPPVGSDLFRPLSCLPTPLSLVPLPFLLRVVVFDEPREGRAEEDNYVSIITLLEFIKLLVGVKFYSFDPKIFSIKYMNLPFQCHGPCVLSDPVSKVVTVEGPSNGVWNRRTKLKSKCQVTIFFFFTTLYIVGRVVTNNNLKFIYTNQLYPFFYDSGKISTKP